jgi:hypothetical protein
MMMRAIDVVSMSRSKGLLWSMPHGRGHLVATGLKVLGTPPPPPPPPPQTGTWHGPSTSGTFRSGECPTANCPAKFPFPTREGPPFAGVICYDTAAHADAGEGPCESWCTKDVNIGTGCGSNANRLCSASRRNVSLTACEAACDAHLGCNSINYNVSGGCDLHKCPWSSVGPPPATPGACCGSVSV